MIRLSNVSKVFPGRSGDITALDRVDLHVPRGEVCGVVGPSGAGKSTLLRCVNLLERPTAGTVEVDGTDLTALPPARLRDKRRGIGMIFQQFALLSSRTAAENVAHPLEIAGVGGAERRRRAAELLQLVGLADRADAYPSQLSGGQQQRVGIARALATEPRVLLCDEATSALDPETTVSILDLLRSLNERLDLTVLLITHDMEVVKRICHRAALLANGRIIESGTVADLVRRGDSAIARELAPRVPSLAAERAAGSGSTIVDVRFVGDIVERPVLADLVRRFDLDVNVIGGGVDVVAGVRLGRLQLELPGRGHEPVLAHLRDLGLQPEVIA